MERECAKIDPRLLVNEIELFEPVGKKQTLGVVRKIQPTINSFQAVKNSLTLSYSVVSSIFSPHEAPKSFLNIGKKCYSHFKDKKNILLFLSFILIAFPILDSTFFAFEINEDWVTKVGNLVISLGWFLIPSWVMGVSGIIIIKSNELNQCLYSAQRMYKWLKGFICGTIISGIILYGSGFIFFCLITVIVGVSITGISYFQFFCLKEWQEIKDEIDWFKWIEKK